jgi:hypothetical protein
MAKNILLLDKTKQLRLRRVFARYQEIYEEVAADPVKIPQASDYDTEDINLALADLLSAVIRGIDITYYCREADCQLITLNSYWPCKRRDDGYPTHWACPHCTRRYFPWSTRRGQTKGQFVITLYGETLSLLPDVDRAWRQLQGQTTMMWKCEWPDSNTSMLLLQMKEIYYGVVHDYNTQGFDSITAAIADYERKSRRDHLKWMGFTKYNKDYLDSENEKMKQAGSKYQWDYSACTPEFPGTFYQHREDDIVFGHDDILRILALTTFYTTKKSAL